MDSLTTLIYNQLLESMQPKAQYHWFRIHPKSGASMPDYLDYNKLLPLHGRRVSVYDKSASNALNRIQTTLKKKGFNPEDYDTTYHSGSPMSDPQPMPKE